MVRQGNVFMRKGMALVPVGPADVAAVQRIPHGAHVAVSLRLDQNPAAHRRWRALLATAAPNTRFGNADNLASIVKLMGGYSQAIELPGDRIGFIERSTSPADMDQIEFSEFLSWAEDFIATEILKGADAAALRRECYAYLSGEARPEFMGKVVP
jgi:hypothetical protein